MSPIGWFIVFKLSLVLAAIAFAVREIVLTRREDSNPELTRKLVRVFSAAGRARHRPRAPMRPRPDQPAAPAAEPELPRRAA